MLADQVDLIPHEIVISFGDLHAYSNHLDQINIQLSRNPQPLPKLVINRKPDSIYDYSFADFEIVGYAPDPHIAGAVAI
jgi:thymidylate synthase